MSISNSDRNRFRIGPGIELHDGDLIITDSLRVTQLNVTTISGITLEVKPPKLTDYIDPQIPPASPRLCLLESTIRIRALGDFSTQYLFYKDLSSNKGSPKQIESITEEFNRLHERAVEISKEIHGNIIYAWKTVRDKMDFDPEKITNRFKEFSEIDARSIETTVPFVDTRSKLSRWIRPYTPEMRVVGQ